MSPAGVTLAAVLDFMFGVLVAAGLSAGADKRAVSAGAMVIGSTAYRLVPLEPRS